MPAISGYIDLPAQALKFRVEPQVVASLEGQGGKTDLQGLPARRLTLVTG
jgi:hypothetical protein